MNLLAIKTDKGVAISPNNRDEEPQSYRYDGKRGEPTHHSRWLMLPELPTTVEQIRPARQLTAGYKLKEGYAVSDATPDTLPSDAFSAWDNSPWDAVRGVYDPVTEDVPEQYEAVEFSVVVLAEIGDFAAYTNFSFDTGKWYDGSPNFKWRDSAVTDKSVQYQLADQIFFHPEALPLRPSRLSSEDSYKIIREHIKQNIDGKYARVTSDYDFCLTVEKVICLAEPYTYDTEVGSGRRKRIEKKLRSTRAVVIYKIAPDRGRDGVYSGYPRCPEFVGENHAGLVKNIKARCDELMAEINRPVHDCPTCKGAGVVLDTGKGERG